MRGSVFASTRATAADGSSKVRPISFDPLGVLHATFALKAPRLGIDKTPDQQLAVTGSLSTILASLADRLRTVH